jgi:hypothetical protein
MHFYYNPCAKYDLPANNAKTYVDCCSKFYYRLQSILFLATASVRLLCRASHDCRALS